MTDPSTQTAQVAVATMAHWIRSSRGRTVDLTMPDAIDGTTPIVRCTIGGVSAAAAIVPLYPVDLDPETLQHKTALEQRLAETSNDPLVLWTPPLAPLPEDDADHLVSHLLEAAATTEPGDRGELALPVQLGLRKTGADGSYLSAQGGLAPHWARFTNQVLGQFQLDSHAIHRLPEDPDKVAQLIDFVVLVANGMQTPGKTVTVDAQDVWTFARLPDLPTSVIVTASPQAAPDDGASVRKTLRAGIKAASDQLASVDAAFKMLIFVGIFRSIKEENAAVALRGMDPSVFTNFDFACLVADGNVKPLYGPKPGTVLSDRKAAADR